MKAWMIERMKDWKHEWLKEWMNIFSPRYLCMCLWLRVCSYIGRNAWGDPSLSSSWFVSTVACDACMYSTSASLNYNACVLCACDRACIHVPQCHVFMHVLSRLDVCVFVCVPSCEYVHVCLCVCTLLHCSLAKSRLHSQERPRFAMECTRPPTK